MSDSPDYVALAGSIVIFVVLLHLLLQLFVPPMHTPVARATIAASITLISGFDAFIGYYLIHWSR